MSNSPSGTVLIVDDHPMFRLGVAHFLRPNPSLNVLEATSHAEANEALRSNHIDLAIVDISLPDGSGLELIREHRGTGAKTRWLVMSVHNGLFHKRRARRAGANGFLGKQAVKPEIMEAVTRLLAGKDFPDGFALITEESESELGSLSEREFTVFRQIAEGKTVEEIATSLDRSRKTINAIRDRIRAKLGIPSSAQLSRFATQWHLDQHHIGRQ